MMIMAWTTPEKRANRFGDMALQATKSKLRTQPVYTSHTPTKSHVDDTRIERLHQNTERYDDASKSPVVFGYKAWTGSN